MPNPETKVTCGECKEYIYIDSTVTTQPTMTALAPTLVVLCPLHSGELADSLAEALSWFIAQGKPDINGDWACAKCRPHSDMLREGFECAFHRGEVLLSDYYARKGKR